MVSRKKRLITIRRRDGVKLEKLQWLGCGLLSYIQFKKKYTNISRIALFGIYAPCSWRMSPS
jgi:hypothetical protein